MIAPTQTIVTPARLIVFGIESVSPQAAADTVSVGEKSSYAHIEQKDKKAREQRISRIRKP